MSEPQPSEDVVKADEPKESQPTGRAVQLPTWERWLSGILGTALGTAGVWAVVVAGKDGAGSVALIVAAIIFWIVGFVGVVPYKLWGKDMGYELGEIEGARKVAEAVADEVSPEVMDNIVEAVTSSRTADLAHRAVSRQALLAHEVAAARDTSKSFVERCSEEVAAAVSQLPVSVRADLVVDNSPNDFGDEVLVTAWGPIYLDYRRSLQGSTYQSMAVRFTRHMTRVGTPMRMLIIAGKASMMIRVENVGKSGLSALMPVVELSSGSQAIASALEDLIDDLRLDARERHTASKREDE